MFKVAVDGATETLCTAGVGVAGGPATVTLSPHAAVTTAAATKRVERRTFMKYPQEVETGTARNIENSS